jgi:hypothetical protein
MTTTTRTKTDTAHILDEIVRASDSVTGLGPTREARRAANAFYTTKDGHFAGGGLYNSNAETDNHLLEMVDGRSYLTRIGLFCLLKRQKRLAVQTRLFPQLRISDGHGHLEPLSEIMIQGLEQLSPAVQRCIEDGDEGE